MTSRRYLLAAACAVVAMTIVVVLAADARSSRATSRADLVTTTLISRNLKGGVPNGPSTNAVISQDKRYSRAIAFQSDASDLVAGDSDGVTDVFAILREAPINNLGSTWKPGSTVLLSKTYNGQPANGRSLSPSIGGSFHKAPKCVGFLSDASNLVAGDTDGVTDAFVVNVRGGHPRRLLLPHHAQPKANVTSVAVSGDCKMYAFVTGGKLYVSKGRHVYRLKTRGAAADPSFSVGLRDDLVFGARGGVYLSKNARSRARLVGRHGRNPAYNDIKRHVVVYERYYAKHWQVFARDLGKRVRLLSKHGAAGDGDSLNPQVNNSGYYAIFQSSADNLSVNSLGRAGDSNGQPDAYFYTDTRKITIRESATAQGGQLPGGGANPNMSFYANYILFDSPAPLGARAGAHQIFMRYLGPV